MRIFLLDITDEWRNFVERMDSGHMEGNKNENENAEEEFRNWASYRGQTLSRTGYF